MASARTARTVQDPLRRNSRGGAPLLVLACAIAAAAALPALPASAKPHEPDVMRKIPVTPADSITISKRSDLQFGRLVMLGGNGGSVTVRAEGLPIYSNFVSIGASPSPAVFEIHGPANRSIEIQLTFPVSGSYGRTGTAKLDGLSVSADYMTGFHQDGSMVRLKLDSSGMNQIVVGGKLTLTGPYSGHTDILFPLTASFVQ
jgi:hypothetical protein